jgi:hypothetical protein
VLFDASQISMNNKKDDLKSQSFISKCIPMEEIELNTSSNFYDNSNSKNIERNLRREFGEEIVSIFDDEEKELLEFEKMLKKMKIDFLSNSPKSKQEKSVNFNTINNEKKEGKITKITIEEKGKSLSKNTLPQVKRSESKKNSHHQRKLSLNDLTNEKAIKLKSKYSDGNTGFVDKYINSSNKKK